MATVAAVRAVDADGPSMLVRNRYRCAQRLRSRALFGWRTRRKGVTIGVSDDLPVRVTAHRIEDTHRGTVSGNCRSGGIAAGPPRDPPPRRGFDRSVPTARSTPPRGLRS